MDRLAQLEARIPRLEEQLDLKCDRIERFQRDLGRSQRKAWRLALANEELLEAAIGVSKAIALTDSPELSESAAELDRVIAKIQREEVSNG